MTASRTSFIAYIVSTPLFLLFIKKYRYIFLVIALTAVFSYIDRDLIQRFAKTIQIKQILVNEETGETHVAQKITRKELPAGTAYVNLRKKVDDTDEIKLLKEKLAYEATLSGRVGTQSADYETVSAVATDISFATRLQVEWPRAIKALIKNPLLGTGPSSITESTDNDYLRWLGEFGLAGFSLFLYILYSIGLFIFQKTQKLQNNIKPLFYSFLFGLLGLAINAGYIDVFEASKVAYIFWYTAGIFVGVLSIPKLKIINK